MVYVTKFGRELSGIEIEALLLLVYGLADKSLSVPPITLEEIPAWWEAHKEEVCKSVTTGK